MKVHVVIEITQGIIRNARVYLSEASAEQARLQANKECIVLDAELKP